jgi:GH24 family phage-related lysozyme (muramidase)
MSTADSDPSPPADTFERAKWQTECAFREREVAVKEREQDSKAEELALKKSDQAAALWKNPLVVAIFAAAVAGLSSAGVAYLNGSAQTALEAQKSEQARILEMIKTGNPDTAAENLRFLLDAGLIRDLDIRRDLTTFLAARKPGTGPVLPSTFIAKDAPELLSKFEGTLLMPYKDPSGMTIIGSGHVITQQELASGTILIGGKSIAFGSGITSDQAKQLLETDLAPIRDEIGRLVKVSLTTNQRDALTSFAFNVGLAYFRRSELLKKLNEGKYSEVPDEMMKKVGFGGTVFPGLVARRKSEVALWNKP